MRYDEFGRELPDTTPVARPAGFRPPPTLTEQIRRMVRGELSQQAAAAGQETFEEADDFDVDDDPPDPTTPWELTFDQQSQPRTVQTMQEEKPVPEVAKKPSENEAAPAAQ